MKICTIVGNRPQFIKLGPVREQIRKHGLKEVLVHTGQHYDTNLSDVFFKDLELPKPDYHLQIHHKTHGAMTGEILTEIEEIFLKEMPNLVLVYGDTNSTLAGSLAAVKLRIPTAHIEAGVRIGDVFSPEEANRVMTSHVAQYHFCCTQHNVDNLAHEGIKKNVFFVGDVMLDTFKRYSQIASEKSNFLKNYALEEGSYVLMTFHRPENIDSQEGCLKLIELIKGLSSSHKVIFLVHPRTQKALLKYALWDRLKTFEHCILTEPLSYLDTLNALNHCAFVVTDSGVLQREAFFAQKYAYFFFKEGCWPEIETAGWQTRYNLFEGPFLFNKIGNAAIKENPFGDGHAAEKIVSHLLKL